MELNSDLKWLAKKVTYFPPHQLSVKRDSDFPMGYCFSPQPFTAGYNGWYSQKEIETVQKLIGSTQDNTMTPEEEAMPADEPSRGERSKYHREIAPDVWVDVYDVLDAWAVQNPALQHLIKKALQPGARGHKTKGQDMDDIVVSAIRARELEK